MTSSTPRLLGGRYELGELIGRGGMAEVHRGYDTRLGRPVAVKILRSDHARDASFLHRFRREAQSVAGLNHRSIVAVYDSGEDRVTESGGAELAVPYIVMELVEGQTLREILNEVGRLDADEAARVCEGVLDALAYSHRMGIVHRDIKPGNVMIGADGSVKVMDFGIARALADAQATMTQTAAVIGTAQYVSPEQARGETVDHRSDVYSVGCLLFELLTGRTPYVGEPISLTYQHVNADIPLPSSLEPDVPPSLDAVVAAALTKDRDQRYEDASDMADDLRAFRSGRQPGALAKGALATVLGAGETRSGVPADPTVALPAAGAAGAAAAHGDTSTFAPVDKPDRPTRRENRRGGLGWVLALLLLIPLVALAWYAWDSSRPEPVQMVTVPQIVGLDEDAAEAKLNDVGLDGDATRENNAAPPGQVFEQGRNAGVEVPRGTSVTYTVSLGPEQSQVPQLVGKTRAQAEKALSEAGLQLGEVTEEDSTEQEKGRVVSANPSDLETVEKGTEVDLVIASGQVELPDLTGQQISEVRGTLYQLGLEVKEVEEVSDAPPGRILRQQPGAGKVNQGSTVTLTIARARDRTVTTTETSSPTETSPTTTEEPDDTTGPPPDVTTGPPESPGRPDPRPTTAETP